MRFTRLLNKPDDFKRIGVSQDKIEVWEDGRRDNNRAGAFEWWYFDAMMDDGTKVVINFGAKRQYRVQEEGGFPFVMVMITRPDGVTHTHWYDRAEAESSFGTDKCDVHIGEHSFVGDLKEYTISVKTEEGIGAELKLTSLTRPWRAGTGYFTFDESGDSYFTWFCAVPKGRVEGHIVVNDELIPVKGYGYHDHQWGNTVHFGIWNHWLWARHNAENHTILIFDFMTKKEFGYKRYPLVFVQDKDGNVIFENMENVELEVVEEYYQDISDKYYPKVSKYVFENNGKKLVYTLTANEEIEKRFDYKMMPEAMQKQLDQIGSCPSYGRYVATGEYELTGCGEPIKGCSDLIYEFAYFCKSYKELD